MERRRWALAVAFVSLDLCTGCGAVLFGAAAGAGVVAYAKGDLHFTEKVELPRAWGVTQAVVDELGFSVVTRSEHTNYGRVVANSHQDQRVQITVLKKAKRVTEFQVRVGVFGDEELSRLIMQKIQARL